MKIQRKKNTQRTIPKGDLMLVENVTKDIGLCAGRAWVKLGPIIFLQNKSVVLIKSPL
jgi:hypothetical protein